MTSQVTRTAEAPDKDHKKPEGMKETKELQKPQTPPAPRSQQPPGHHHGDQPLSACFVPLVTHLGGWQPNSFRFLFYSPRLSNSYQPFYTAQKATCGYRFHRDTDHTRKVLDVQSANTVKWRPILGTKPRQ
ncbi:putative uncharacterized protein CIMIP3 [Melanerpes formicivorus]|uniref:putative uncharacterized protein CIMIP3 n=1 Tax=Melanerpes formicivorus TaxID=211600 RepID=UPI00358DDAC8